MHRRFLGLTTPAILLQKLSSSVSTWPTGRLLGALRLSTLSAAGAHVVRSIMCLIARCHGRFEIIHDVLGMLSNQLLSLAGFLMRVVYMVPLRDTSEKDMVLKVTILE